MERYPRSIDLLLGLSALNNEPANVNAAPQMAAFSQPSPILKTTIARAPALTI